MTKKEKEILSKVEIALGNLVISNNLEMDDEEYKAWQALIRLIDKLKGAK